MAWPGMVYGRLTPALNVELKKLLETEEWPPPEEPSPEFALILTACDYAFLLKRLKEKCEEYGLSTRGHKKILCARLIKVEDEEVMMAITDPAILEIARILTEKGGA